ncbi:hypothetical protein [Halochromatium salexigens]|uniref:Uncharacterized protein n=1 Tax=Halochromatium salexigens TaxID=49447 RepID=A0AAJ0XGX9_HALSE|nr:hypothetical protein [Halochromatium salexigens]MBK5931185.1 hypothetical protein [Halochromatium salexigens]
MRDYKSSGGFSLRKRRRFPRGLILLTVLLLIAAALGYVFTEYLANPATTPSARPSSGRTVIPLPIPGQQAEPTANDAD